MDYTRTVIAVLAWSKNLPVGTTTKLEKISPGFLYSLSVVNSRSTISDWHASRYRYGRLQPKPRINAKVNPSQQPWLIIRTNVLHNHIHTTSPSVVWSSSRVFTSHILNMHRKRKEVDGRIVYENTTTNDGKFIKVDRKVQEEMRRLRENTNRMNLNYIPVILWNKEFQSFSTILDPFMPTSLIYPVIQTSLLLM